MPGPLSSGPPTLVAPRDRSTPDSWPAAPSFAACRGPTAFVADVAGSTASGPNARGSAGSLAPPATRRATASRRTALGIAAALAGDGRSLPPVREWSTLVNPDAPIPPFIETLTGITNAMVADAPRFEDLADDILARLDGRLFIAHNARFDHGFLKNAFRRLGHPFRPPVLCTVRLSRKLYPGYARHNLDTLIERHRLVVDQRHRALGDARLLWQLWQRFHDALPAEQIAKAIDQLTARPSLPRHLDPDVLDTLPKTAGVYLFHGAPDESTRDHARPDEARRREATADDARRDDARWNDARWNDASRDEYRNSATSRDASRDANRNDATPDEASRDTNPTDATRDDASRGTNRNDDADRRPRTNDDTTRTTHRTGPMRRGTTRAAARTRPMRRRRTTRCSGMHAHATSSRTTRRATHRPASTRRGRCTSARRRTCGNA